MLQRYFGIDIHKKFSVAVAVDGQQTVLLKPQKILTEELATWAANTLTVHDSVVIEVTTNTWFIYDILAQHAGHVVVANPQKTRLIAAARIKSDKVDALALARLLAARFIYEVWVPDCQLRQERALVAHRMTLARQIGQVKNRIQAFLARHGYRCPVRSVYTKAGRSWLKKLDLPLTEQLERTQLLAQLDLLEEQRNAADALIAQISSTDERVTRLMQVSGVGSLTAFAIVAAIGDIQRFSTAKKLSAYAGLVPSLRQSGERAFTGRITKAGNTSLRWLLVEAAWSAIRCDPHWQRQFEQLSQRRGNSIAIVAIARKLLVVVWHLWHDHAIYHHLQPQSFVRKLQERAWRVGKQNLTYATSADFVRAHLKKIGLHELALALVSSPNGMLKVNDSSLNTPAAIG